MREVEVFQAARLLYGGPVALLSSRLERESNVMTVSWVISLSTSPPLVGVSLTPSCWSHHLIRESGEFVLNIPDVTMIKAVHGCGTFSGRDIDKVRMFDISLATSRMVKPMQVIGSVGVIECEVRDWQEYGDRSFVVAEIVYAAADEEEFDRHWLPDSRLIRHLGGNRYQCGAQIIEVGRVSLPDGRGKVIMGPEIP